MHLAVMDEEEAQLRLDASISGFAERAPTLSARDLSSNSQKIALAVAAVLVVIGTCLNIIYTATAIVGIVTVFYTIAVVYRFVLFIRSGRQGVVEVVTDEDARSVADEDLPLYTVLIPVYKEAAILPHLVEKVHQLEYPESKLEVFLLVEADDHETLATLAIIDPGLPFEIVVVPAADPRTKPKALNFGLTLANGELVAIYDAEDDPDPLQLRKAAVAMSRQPAEAACLQGKLAYNNIEQNIITKWFAIEYRMWFSFFLPGLVSFDSPIPLGGTSNHFRRSALRSLGGWDPYNVTEDADLGIRMSREGYSVKVLESTTLEEANSDFVNWVKQRSRWYKGYLQTFIVHSGSVRELSREMGWRKVFHFTVFVGGTPVLAAINPIFWAATLVWFTVHPSWMLEVFHGPVYYLGLLCWSVGNFLMVYITLLASRGIKNGILFLVAMLVPLYWIMMALAAFKAFLQLVVTPNLWEKTTHGLKHHHPAPTPEAVMTGGSA